MNMEELRKNILKLHNVVILWVFGNKILWMTIALVLQILALHGIGPKNSNPDYLTKKYIIWFSFSMTPLALFNTYVFSKLLFITICVTKFALQKGKNKNYLINIICILFLCLLFGGLLGFLPAYIVKTTKYFSIFFLYSSFWLWITFVLLYCCNSKKILSFLLFQITLIIGGIMYGVQLLHNFYQKLCYPYGYLIYSFNKLENIATIELPLKQDLFYPCILFYIIVLFHLYLLLYLSSEKIDFKKYKPALFFTIKLLLPFLFFKTYFYVCACRTEKEIEYIVHVLEKKQNRQLDIESLQKSLYHGENPDDEFWDKIYSLTEIMSVKESSECLYYFLDKYNYPQIIKLNFTHVVEIESNKAFLELERLYLTNNIPPYYCVIDGKSIFNINTWGISCILKFYRLEIEQINSLLEKNEIYEAINKFKILHNICCQLRFGGSAQCAKQYFKIIKMNAELVNHFLLKIHHDEYLNSLFFQYLDEEIAIFELLKTKLYNDMVIEYLYRAEQEDDLVLLRKHKFTFSFNYWSRVHLKLNLAKMFLNCSSFDDIINFNKYNSIFLFIPFSLPIRDNNPFGKNNQELSYFLDKIKEEYNFSRRLK